jgi:uncharacterized protein YecE (DUF72 family)
MYIGPAGWSYPDWQGIVYPKKKPRNFSELEFISKYFNSVEINSSFYKIPTLSTVDRWIRNVEKRDDFKFCVKLWQRFTHSEFSVEQSDIDQFRKMLTTLVEAERLGPLLLQFPWRFKKSKATVKRTFEIIQQFQGFSCALEFRHAGWQDESLQADLRENGIAFVNIDQPVIGESLAPSAVVTSNEGYVRFHGRNEAAWFAENAGRDERYNYLYNNEEIGSWIESIDKMSEQTDSMYIIFNNHFRGKALINAFELKYQMTSEKPLAPESLFRHFPNLIQFAKPDSSGQTMQMF